MVLGGHSYGGAVALITALRGRVTPRALALFEPVAVPVLAAVGDAEAFAAAQALFEGYCAAFEGGDPEAARIMVDYWFGAGALDQMPAPIREYLIAHTGHNVGDVRATFATRTRWRRCAACPMPVLCVHGSRSVAMMVKIVEAIASHAPRGIIRKLEKANHAMTTTHPDAVAALIADGGRERVSLGRGGAFLAAGRRSWGAVVMPRESRAAGAARAAPIPKTGERLPAVGLGTWQVFDVAGDAEELAQARETLRVFVERGGRVIDSSPMYGSSEAVTGQLAAELGVQPKLFVATKVWTSGKQAGIRQMEDSMRKLRVKRLDLMQVHNLVDVSDAPGHPARLEGGRARPLPRRHPLPRGRARRPREAHRAGATSTSCR